MEIYIHGDIYYILIELLPMIIYQLKLLLYLQYCNSCLIMKAMKAIVCFRNSYMQDRVDNTLLHEPCNCTLNGQLQCNLIRIHLIIVNCIFACVTPVLYIVNITMDPIYIFDSSTYIYRYSCRMFFATLIHKIISCNL